MKKLTAIFLLSVHLFNLAGYSLLFQYLIGKAALQLTQQIENNSYNNKDLALVKVPLHMPCINDTKDFERVNGQLEYKGVYYNYVKQKISADTLFLLRLPNISKTQLSKAEAIYSKQANGIPTGNKSAESAKKKNILCNYSHPVNQYAVIEPRDTAALHVPATSIIVAYNYVSIPEQPPKNIC